MLALKTILAEIDSMPTMIFDEIDAGIGGRTAYTIGQKLKQIAKVRQVLCVTHLPQIACMADAHFLVEKKVSGNRTKIEARRLNEEERVHEIARMLGGKNTEITLAHAREMLNDNAAPINERGLNG
jgi:DNA repair protein RecN (Recombination protein N)